MGTPCHRHRRVRRTGRVIAVLVALLLVSVDAIVGLNSTGSWSSDTPAPTTPTPTTSTPTPTPTPTPPTPTTPTPTSTTPTPTTTAPPVTTTPPTTTPQPEPDAGDPTPEPTTPTPTTAAPATAAPTTTPPATTKPVPTKRNVTGSHSGSDSVGGLSAGSDRSPTATDSTASKSSSGKYGLVVAVVVFVVVVLVALVYVLRRHRSKKEETNTELRRQLDQLDMELGESAYAMAAGDHAAPTSGSYSRSSNHIQKVRSPSSWSSSRTTAPGSAGDRDSLSAMWKDPEILSVRIPYEKIKFRELISRGGFGEVFQGVYHNQHVAIKRLLPENRRRLANLEDFMKEAHLLSTLDHERIVQFIGVAWDSPRDLCIVLEYMPNGDLRSMLKEWRELGRKSGWADVRKVRIALHIAEALTYLHTLTPRVVHRDLKSKNVLLDEHWQAKISDFGVSREESTHNTMTSNVGSSLWIAPEVMMGNNYDEKADIFSFGIVLTELDSLQLPYHNAVSPDGRKLPDAAVLHLVTMGKLQAEFTSMSRTDMVLLGRSCLALDPAQRPTAAEARHRLSQILGSY